MGKIKGWTKSNDMNNGDKSTLWYYGYTTYKVEIIKRGLKYYEIHTPDGIFYDVTKKEAYKYAISYMREFNKQKR